MQISVAVSPLRQIILQVAGDDGKAVLVTTMETSAALALAEQIKSCAEMANNQPKVDPPVPSKEREPKRGPKRRRGK